MNKVVNEQGEILLNNDESIFDFSHKFLCDFCESKNVSAGLQ
jgi:hypothetical protein